MAHLTVASPFGPLTLFEDAGALVALEWGRGPKGAASDLLARAAAQLEAYFQGRLRRFDLPLRPRGTAFQERVWREMARIPHGRVRTYAELAAAAGSAPRPVGAACGRNPLPIFLPCHRVIGAGGRLGGYSAGEGPATKLGLLRLEGVRLDGLGENLKAA